MSSMPKHKGPDLQEDRNLPKFDYISFMEKMTLDNDGESSGNGKTKSSRQSSPVRPGSGKINGNGMF